MGGASKYSQEFLLAANEANWFQVPNPKMDARFIEPMLLVSTEKLPEGESWVPRRISRVRVLCQVLSCRVGCAT